MLGASNVKLSIQESWRALNRRQLTEVLTSADVETSETVGARIRRLRKGLGLTQDELADRAGISRPQLSKLENDEADARSATLMALAGALGVTTSALLGQTAIRVVRELHSDNEAPAKRDNRPLFQVIDFHEGLVEVPLWAEVACGEPMDHSVEGDTILVPAEYAADPSKNEVTVRARGDSMVEYGIKDGWYVVVERRPGGVAASGELILAWYEPAEGAAPGGITLKHWIRRGGKKILQGSTPETTFELQEGDIFELRGIVRRAYPPPIIFPKISG